MNSYDNEKKGSCLHSVLKAIAILFAIYAILFVMFWILERPNGDREVYTTATGECYHLYRCSSLRHSKIKTTIEEAVLDGYRTCGNCKPPKLIAKKASPEFSLSNICIVSVLSIPVSFFVWYISVYLFHFLGIEDCLLKFRWYQVSAIIFVFILFFT